MENYLEFIVMGIVAAIISLLLFPVMKIISKKIGLVDKPNHRKIHINHIPLIGGVVIVIASFIAILFSQYLKNIVTENYPIFIAAFLLFVVGVLDDRFDINAKYKFVIQLGCAFIVAASGVRLHSFFGIFGVHTIPVVVQYAFTIILITGVVNAFNLLDGIDGLLGSYAALGFLFLFIVAIIFHSMNLASVSVVYMSCLLIFIKNNFAEKKIFMGDAGSLFLGFILICFSIKTINKIEHEKSADIFSILVLFVSYFSIPVFDSLRVYQGRIKRGDSPLKADRSHLHHILLNFGLTPKKIDLLIVLIAIVLVALNYFLKTVLNLNFIVGILLLIYILFSKFFYMLYSFFEWKKKINDIENY